MKSRPLVWVLLISAAAALGYFGWQRFYGPQAGKAESAQKAAPRIAAVPVKIAPVVKADFPVYLLSLIHI